MLVASSVLLQDIKCDPKKKNLSLTTKIKSLPLFDLEKPSIKFISTQGS
jgi:hypothetical protein